MKLYPSRSWSVCCVAVLVLLLAGCSGLVIHDEPRATLAAQGKQAFADAKVLDVLDTEQANLDYLLSEEIKSIRESQGLQVDFATLAIANNVGPMGASYLEATQRLTDLGFASAAEVRKLGDAEITRAAKARTIKSDADALRALGFSPPSCGALPGTVSPPPALATIFASYQKSCKELTTIAESGGLLGQAYTDWMGAKLDLDAAKQDQAVALENVKKATAAYQAAASQVADGKKTASSIATEVTDKEAQLTAALQAAQGLRLGGPFGTTIDSLVDLLTAAASGNTDPSDPRIASAAVVLKQFPSLASAAAELQAARTAPPVSGLLLQLQRQTTLASVAKSRQELEEKRVTILEARYDAFRAEAQQWLRFTDATCTFASPVASPGDKCDSFSVESTKGAFEGCSFAGTKIASCPLAAAWNDSLRTQPPAKKRQLYKGVNAYLQAIALQSAPLEQQFREVDVRHREALLQRRGALEAWNSLVAVPLDQLNAYYQGGIKPAELADLAVKALGFTAIAIGVSR